MTMTEVATPSWYVIRARLGQQQKAFDHLQPITTDILLPRHQTDYVIRNKQQSRQHPTFGPYIFIAGEMTAKFWHDAINRTTTLGFVGPKDEKSLPYPIPASSIDSLRSRLNENGLLELPKPPAPWRMRVGDRVKIISGVGTAQEGVCIRTQKAGGDVKIEKGLFGRANVIYVSSNRCVPIDPPLDRKPPRNHRQPRWRRREIRAAQRERVMAEASV